MTFFLGTNVALSGSELLAAFSRHGISYDLHAATGRSIRAAVTPDLPPDFIKSLGGTLRISIDVASWNAMPSGDDILDALGPLPDKWHVGLGSIGMSQNMSKVGVGLKKAARARGSKLSFIEARPGSRAAQHSTILNAGQVLFYKLTHSPNAELIFLRHDNTVTLMKTVAIQDIASYELRDTSRPARNARVGMLPPKLAQIMINLALGSAPQSAQSNSAVYDPFCGMGTILQEAWLMGIPSFGTDVSAAMIRASEENIEHIARHFPINPAYKPRVALHDATDQHAPEDIPWDRITVVTEPFLGAPQNRPLQPSEVSQFFNSVMPLYRTFFLNMKRVLPEHARILMLFPAPKAASLASRTAESAWTPLPREFLDEVRSFGYRKVQIVPPELARTATDTPLLYARPDALVAREITLWERI